MVKSGFFGGLVSVLLLSPLAFCGLDKLLPKPPVPPPLEVSERAPAVPLPQPGPWAGGLLPAAPVGPPGAPTGSPAADALPHWTGPTAPLVEKPKKKSKPAPKKAPEAPKCGLDVIGALKGECKQ